ncbi:MAG: serine/threonine-protein kinase [Planctomycetota bacterium]
MTPEPADPLDALFDEFLALAPEARQAWLDGRELSDSTEEEFLQLARAADSWQPGKPDAVVDALTSQQSELPERIGPYRVEGILGAGGMGMVYLAEQEQPRRKVAVKVLRQLLTDPPSRRRFELEAEFLGRLQHRGIAQVIEAGQVDDGTATAYIALEYVEGQGIVEWTRARSATRNEVLELLIQICDAVHHAHTRGVIHRDLKPGNVLVTGQGDVKLIDFGVARAVDEHSQATRATEVGQVVGTLAYMSPEQLLGQIDSIDVRTDVYSIGVLAHQLVAGSLPYDLSATSVGEAIVRLTRADPPRLRSVVPDVSADLEAVVARAMTRELDQRYQSAAALADELRRVLEGRPVLASNPSGWNLMVRMAKRNRGLAGSLAAVLFAIVVGAVVAIVYAMRADAALKREQQALELADARLIELQVTNEDLEDSSVSGSYNDLLFEPVLDKLARLELPGAENGQLSRLRRELCSAKSGLEFCILFSNGLEQIFEQLNVKIRFLMKKNGKYFMTTGIWI